MNSINSIRKKTWLWILLIWMVDFGKIFDSAMDCIKCWVKVDDLFWIQSIQFGIMEYCWMFFELDWRNSINSIWKQTWLCNCCWIFLRIQWLDLIYFIQKTWLCEYCWIFFRIQWVDWSIWFERLGFWMPVNVFQIQFWFWFKALLFWWNQNARLG